MKTTDNFRSILGKIDHRDLHDLYTSTQLLKMQGSFECFKNHVNGCYYIKCTYLYDTILLKNDVEKTDFLSWIKLQIKIGDPFTSPSLAEEAADQSNAPTLTLAPVFSDAALDYLD